MASSAESWEIIILAPPGGGLRARQVADAVAEVLRDRFPDVYGGLRGDMGNQMRSSGQQWRKPVYSILA